MSSSAFLIHELELLFKMNITFLHPVIQESFSLLQQTSPLNSLHRKPFDVKALHCNVLFVAYLIK